VARKNTNISAHYIPQWEMQRLLSEAAEKAV
jgi:hypothetical protein